MNLKSNIKDFALYIAVGGIATLTEWGIFYLGSKIFLNLHYAVITAAAYIISTFVNWGVGRILVFKECRKSFLREIAEIYISSVLGLALNLLIMFLCVDFLNVNKILSKIIATGLVFAFNFLIRKIYIYKK